MKKRIAMVLSLVCAVSLLAAACGNSKKEVADTDTSAGKTKTIKIVTGGDGEPFSLIDNDGKWTGIDAEIWAEIEKRTGWKAEVEKTTFDSVFGELDAGRADVAANCFAAKEERNEKYQPSISYYGDAQTIAVADDNKDIQTFDDLKDKKVGIISGQASQTILDEMSKEIGFDVVTYEQANIGCQDLTLGRIDAMASAVTVFNNYMEANDTKVRMLDEKLLANNVAYYFPKTDEGKDLCKEVDKELQDMLDDGTIAKITEKWLFADMTKLITK